MKVHHSNCIGRSILHHKLRRADFLDYYRELLAYKDAPSAEVARQLKSKFWRLFTTPSSYELLDERQQLTAAKISELRASFRTS
jgi:hypothetical protein